MNRYFRSEVNFIRFDDNLTTIIRMSQLFDVLSKRD